MTIYGRRPGPGPGTGSGADDTYWWDRFWMFVVFVMLAALAIIAAAAISASPTELRPPPATVGPANYRHPDLMEGP